MNDSLTTIVTAVVGFVTTALAWRFGGKQKAHTERLDAELIISKGADQIIDTGSKLLATLEKMLEEERGHRTACENALAEHKTLISDLSKKVKSLEAKMKAQ